MQISSTVEPRGRDVGPCFRWSMVIIELITKLAARLVNGYPILCSRKRNIDKRISKKYCPSRRPPCALCLDWSTILGGVLGPVEPNQHFGQNRSDENCVPGNTTTTGVSCKTCLGNRRGAIEPERSNRRLEKLEPCEPLCQT